MPTETDEKSHLINLWKYILLPKLIFKFGHLNLSALTSDDDDVIPNGDGGKEIRLRVNNGKLGGDCENFFHLRRTP